MPAVLDLPAVECAARSDPGRDPTKQVNEDAVGQIETRFGHLCVVCDGMGGHAAGREAAELARATIFETFERAPDGAPPARVLREALVEANRRVHVMTTTEVAQGRPGATVVAALMHAHGTELAHVGDSRAYFIHEGQIGRLTRDHSVVQEMVDRGLLTSQEAAHHPDANQITRALGMAPELEPDVAAEPVRHVPGDAFVLCSDGLSDLVDDLEILLVVGDVPAEQAVGQLVDLANARGGHDNVSVIILRARNGAVGAGAVAPTVAQTSVLAPAAAPVAPAARVTPAGIPAAPIESTIPGAPPFPPVAPPRRLGASAVVGLGLGAVAVALFVAIVAAEMAERGGKSNASGGSKVGEITGAHEAGGAPPVPLVPGTVVVPGGASGTPSIAPLEPAPHAQAKQR